MKTEKEKWLDLTVEETIEPDLPICDPHHHLWDYPGSRYLLNDLWQDTGSGHNVLKTVFVECMSEYRRSGPPELQPVGEVEFVDSVANQSAANKDGKSAVVSGIVGFADLSLSKAVEPVLQALVTASKRTRGIRYSSAWDAAIPNSYRNSPKGYLYDSKFRGGFSWLQKYNLSFDAWLYHPQLTELADLARSFPETLIILDHIGGVIGIGPYAGKREEVFQHWKEGIAEVSACPNVAVKLGGLGMPFCGFGWNERTTPPNSTELAEAMAPYYRWCIEQFGVNRCMFESNFPVDKVSYSYGVMWNAFKRICQDLSPEEKVALFHDTAARIYRLSSNY
jgi:L-fuconolactonase